VSGSTGIEAKAITVRAAAYSGRSASSTHSCTLRMRRSSTISQTWRMRPRNATLSIIE
jgi:hypothetical protein